jgi:NADH-quinone oxidoreductase subunit L
MAMFMMFWTFSTLDFYKPGEITNPNAGQGHGEEHADEAGGEEESALVLTVFSPQSQDDGGEEHEADASEETAAHVEGEEGDHAAEEEHTSTLIRNTVHWSDEDVELRQLGVFGQTEYLLHQQEESGEQIDITFGPVTFSLKTTLVIITLFLLLGATGKSAQIPLFVWLPDAMAGPTPVSALIHAATMVTAGVYMMVRSNVLFSNAEFTSFVVTVIGASTALVAGYIAMGQFDIKRVLAYSTISQLGFMVAAVGVGAYVAAIFHMVTHAFFKALLFLGSGSVIHGVEHGHHHAHAHEHGDEHDDDHEDEFDPQDMRNMGGLSRGMPITYITYLIGTLALAGIYPLAGFWSKDEILADSWLVGLDDGQLKGYIAFGLLLIAAGFTAFYMWRQIEMVFHGDPRTDAADHASESVPSMTVPLMILAFFSIFAGVINIPTPLNTIFTVFLSGIFGHHSFSTFLEHSIAEFHVVAFQPIIALLALSLGIGAIFFARSIYRGNKAVKIVDGEMKDPLEVDPAFSAIWGLAHARLYWDQTYFRLFVYPYQRMSAFLANVIDWQFLHDYFHDSVLLRGYNGIGNLLSKPFDLGIIDGAVNGVAWVVRTISGRSRHVQTGYVRTYAVALLLGVVAVIVIMLLPLIKL